MIPLLSSEGMTPILPPGKLASNTPNAIGLLGRTLSTTQQWILINNIKNKLILFLDGDSAGDQSTVDVYNKLSLFIDKLEICYLDSQDDPGSHGLETNAQTLTKLLKPYEWLKKKKIFIEKKNTPQFTKSTCCVVFSAECAKKPAQNLQYILPTDW